jgi:hypothetical protein
VVKPVGTATLRIGQLIMTLGIIAAQISFYCGANRPCAGLRKLLDGPERRHT